MSKLESDPLGQASQEIPERWYENFRNLKRIGIVTVGCTTGLFEFIATSGNDKLAYHLTGAIIYLAGAAFDTLSTMRFLDAINKAESHGVKPMHGEANILVQDITDPKEFFYNPKRVAKDLIFTVVSFGLPPLGITVGLLKFIALKNNLRIARRYDRASEIALANSDEIGCKPAI